MADMKDTQQDREKVLGPARYWQNELEQADQFERDWRERGMRVVERYRDEREGRALIGPSNSRYNILWANTETLRGALFARMAEPDVRRRFPDPNPAAQRESEACRARRNVHPRIRARIRVRPGHWHESVL